MKIQFKALVDRLSTNPWIVLLLLLKDFVEIVVSVAGWAVPRLKPMLPVMNRIDWVDFALKAIVCAVVIVLQRLVKRTRLEQAQIIQESASFRKDHEAWKEEQRRQWVTLGVAHRVRTSSIVKISESERAALPSLEAIREAWADRFVATIEYEWYNMVRDLQEKGLSEEEAKRLADDFFDYRPTHTVDEARQSVVNLPPPRAKKDNLSPDR